MDRERYERQMIVPQIGKMGQKKIYASCVAIVGLGGLGSIAAELLVRAGVGKVIIIDRDIVEESNLTRQFYLPRDVGRSKVAAAKERLSDVNPSLIVEGWAIHLQRSNIMVLQEADVILDCTDNLRTRFLINWYCRTQRKKWIYAAAIKTAGYVMPILPGGPCVQCFLQEGSLETCDQVGVINTTTTSIAALQVNFCLRLLIGEEVEPRLYYYDVWKPEFRLLAVKKRKNCQGCDGKYLFPEETKWVHFCSTGRYQIEGKHNLNELRNRLGKRKGLVDDGEILSLMGITLFADGRALVKAETAEKAMMKYSKMVGD